MNALCSLSIPIAAVAVNMLVQIALFRRWRGDNYFNSIIGGFAAGFTSYLAFESVLLWNQHSPDDFAVALLVNGPTYAALGYCYYSFVQLGQTSIRIRLYSEIAGRADGLGADEVAREYSDDALMQVRLQRLVDSGDIVKRSGRYYVGRSRLVWIGNALCVAKQFLLGKSSEFD